MLEPLANLTNPLAERRAEATDGRHWKLDVRGWTLDTKVGIRPGEFLLNLTSNFKPLTSSMG